MTDGVAETIDERGVAALTFNRPELHNAFDEAVIAVMRDKLTALAGNPGVRALRLQARGKSFCAGADLNWMKRVANYDHAQNVGDAMALANMLRALRDFPVPTLAAVQGSAFGGGVGVIACCDIVVAAETAKFSLSEVRLGLIPATISPFVLEAMGHRHALRYSLTAERFDAHTAQRIGLVHEVVEPRLLEARAAEIEAELLKNGPQAMIETKRLLAMVADQPIDDELLGETARRIAERRAAPEGKEGIDAFLGKREPAWRNG